MATANEKLVCTTEASAVLSVRKVEPLKLCHASIVTLRPLLRTDPLPVTAVRTSEESVAFTFAEPAATKPARASAR